MFGSGGVWGGGERFALEIARTHAERVPTRLLVFGRRSQRLRLGKLSIHVLGTRMRDGSRPRNPRPDLLAAEIARARVVHLHQMESKLTEVSALLARGLGRRVFVTDHGAASGVLPRRLRSSLFHGHLAVSSYAAEGYPELLDRTQVIYGGVDPQAFTPGAATRDRLIVFVGRLLPHKGIDVLIRALPLGARLEIYGRVYSTKYAEDLADLAQGKDVRFEADATDAEHRSRPSSLHVATRGRPGL